MLDLMAEDLVDAALNESPSEKEGKSSFAPPSRWPLGTLNESPSEKEGKSPRLAEDEEELAPSMKVPPKRKGNSRINGRADTS